MPVEGWHGEEETERRGGGRDEGWKQYRGRDSVGERRESRTVRSRSRKEHKSKERTVGVE